MKSFVTFTLIASLGIALFTACDQAAPAATLANVGTKIDIEKVRAGLRKMDVVSAASLSKADLATIEQIVVKQQSAAAADDARTVANIFNTLQAAENKAQELTSVKVSMSDEPIQDGVFLFAVESSVSQHLTLEMYDEEGFQMAANNKIVLSHGNNYKALNVNSLENGNYIVRLKDDEGKELVRQVQINKE